MATRQPFYQESLGESSTTNQNWVDKCVCTFTPDANSSYWILASWSHTSDAAASGDRSQTRLYSVESAVAFNIGEMRPHELTTPQDYINAFALGKLTFGASPAPQNVKIQYTCYGPVTTKIKDARILVLEADAADQMAEATGWSSSSSQTYQTKATLTWTPGSSGDYLIIAAAQIASDANADAVYFQLNYVTGASVYGDRIWYCVDGWDNHPFVAMAKLTSLAVPRPSAPNTRRVPPRCWLGSATRASWRCASTSSTTPTSPPTTPSKRRRRRAIRTC